MSNVRLYQIEGIGRLKEIECNFLTFPGGEPHCRLDAFVRGKDLIVDLRFSSMEDLGYALVVIDACQRDFADSISLFIPYFPGARQDHPIEGTPLTVGVFAKIINGLRLDHVFILDPHSDVTPALIDRCMILDHWSHMSRLIHNVYVRKYEAVICPDAGAEKRTYAAQSLNLANKIIFAHKRRNPITGHLSDIEVDPIAFGRCLIVDDICDGGGTFIGIVQAAQKGNYDDLGPIVSFDLLTTHGIYSKGFSELDRYFQTFFTTDSVPRNTSSEQPFYELNLIHAFKVEITNVIAR